MAQNFDPNNTGKQDWKNEQAQSKGGADVNAQSSAGTGGLTDSSADLAAQNTKGMGGQPTYGNQQSGQGQGGYQQGGSTGGTNSGQTGNTPGLQEDSSEYPQKSGTGSAYKTGGQDNTGTPSQGKE